NAALLRQCCGSDQTRVVGGRGVTVWMSRPSRPALASPMACWANRAAPRHERLDLVCGNSIGGVALIGVGKGCGGSDVRDGRVVGSDRRVTVARHRRQSVRNSARNAGRVRGSVVRPRDWRVRAKLIVVLVVPALAVVAVAGAVAGVSGGEAVRPGGERAPAAG